MEGATRRARGEQCARPASRPRRTHSGPAGAGRRCLPPPRGAALPTRRSATGGSEQSFFIAHCHDQRLGASASSAAWRRCPAPAPLLPCRAPPAYKVLISLRDSRMALSARAALRGHSAVTLSAAVARWIPDPRKAGGSVSLASLATLSTGCTAHGIVVIDHMKSDDSSYDRNIARAQPP